MPLELKDKMHPPSPSLTRASGDCTLSPEARVHPRAKGDASGFTMVELLVSILVIGIISGAVIGDILRTRQQMELLSSASLIQNEMRNMQADALAARSIKTCAYSGNNVPCEYDTIECHLLGQVCSGSVSPPEFGMTFTLNATTTPEYTCPNK